VGDQVMAAILPFGPDGGAQAELVVVPAASVVPIPDNATLQQAATLPMNGLTAIAGLEQLGLSAGDTLAISGAAGVLGSYVIPLAKERGLRVIADASEADADAVRSYGADVVIPRSDDFAAAVRAVEPDGVDAVYDAATLNDGAIGAVRDGGGVAILRPWNGESDRVTLHMVSVAVGIQRTDWLEELRELASDGRITLRALESYPPERAGEAQERMDAGGLRGRLLIEF
jgi:NADPH:quinone reductase-like Zn-dependent oxidoreductase